MAKRMLVWTAMCPKDEVAAKPDAPSQAGPGGGASMESFSCHCNDCSLTTYVFSYDMISKYYGMISYGSESNIRVQTSLGAEGWKILTVGHCFSSISDNSRKNNGQAFLGTFAPRLYNFYTHAHAPGQHMWQSPGPEPDSKCSKTVEVGCSCQELKPCHREITNDEIEEKKI